MIKFEHLKGTNGIAANGVLWGCENSIDQLRGFSLIAPLHDRTHRFCGFFSHYDGDDDDDDDEVHRRDTCHT